MTVGIICEYNPLHLGHRKQIQRIRETFGDETAIVCAMSGNFVQRGAPAIIDKSLRAKAAIFSGADLVLELPVTTSLPQQKVLPQAASESFPICVTFFASVPKPQPATS